MNKAFYFVFFLLISDLLFSQTGTPFIKNFSPEDFQNETQIWDAVQDNSGIMFFGCNTGILQYDGQTWQKISVPNNSPVRSLCINNKGIIFAGSVGEFGYLKLTNTEGYKYISLSDKTVGLNSHFTDVWTVETAGKNVYFATAEFLFRYNPDKIPSVKKISTANPPFLLYKPKQEVYVSIRGKGTGKLIGDSIIPLKGLEKVHPWFMISYNKSCDIIGNLDGLTVYCPAAESSDKVISSDTLFNKKYIEATNNFLRKNQLYTGAVALGNNKFAIGTLRNGVIIINQYGKIINIINESKGLQNNTIHALYKDFQNELWVCTADGISKIDINSPYELFDKNDGIKGSIYDVLRFHNKFYVTTNLGLYYYTNSGFEGVKGLSGKDAIQILSFFIFKTETDSVFFVNTIYGMYRINKNKPTKINALNYSSFIQSEFKKNTVYYTKDYSLYKMTFRNNTFINPEKISVFKSLVNIGSEINKDNLILIINEKPVIYNLVTHNFSEIKTDIKVFDTEQVGKTIFA
ncbi:MAG: hypothetical protein L3J56_04920, partial [Bacteroidales bacterium]|nr:hypothetical protein [Bacteroidales bacterium]